LLLEVFVYAGFLFFLGFYSKDFIISRRSLFRGSFIYFIFLLGCFFTVMYRIRLVYKSFKVIPKYNSFGYSVEELWFFLPVSILFFKCWILGGFLYWLILSGVGFFLTFFDLFVGLILFFLGFSIYFFLVFFYPFIFILGMIFFLRWKTASGVSNFFEKLVFSDFESTWIEIGGGKGVYFYISIFNIKLEILRFASLGTIMFFVFFLVFYYF